MLYCNVRLKIDPPNNDPLLLVNGKITFTPDIARGDVWSEDDTIYPSGAVEGDVQSGVLKYKGSSLVRLMAGGSGVNPSVVYWRVSFSDMTLGDEQLQINPFVFEAVPNTTIDLAKVTPVAGYTPMGIIRGRAGMSFKGAVASASQLPSNAGEGEGWYNLSTKELMVWDGSKWEPIPDFGNVNVDVENLQSFVNLAEQASLSAQTHEGNAMNAASVAEHWANETIQQVTGDFATRNYVDATKWETRWLTSGENLNDATAVGQYRSTLPSITQSLVNAPAGARSDKAILFVLGRTGEAVQQIWFPIQGSTNQDVYIRSRTAAGTWFPWERLLRGKDAWDRGTLTSNTDLNTVTESGVYWSGLYSITSTLVNRPPGTAGIPTGFFTVHNVGGGLIKQRWEKVSSVGQYQSVMERQRDVSGNWSDWRDSNPGQSVSATEMPEPAARAEMLRQASKLRRGRVVGTSGATPVALSFDHGTTNFRNLVLPHLIRLGLPCSLAFMPDGMGTTGDDATWTELQTWSLNHGVELAHHARSHDDVPNALDDIPALEYQLLSSIEDANTNIPEVVADAFIMPGVSDTGYGGFNGGISDPSLLYTHPAGRMILSNFPVITWGALGQAVPMIGEPVQFVDRIGIDTASFATLAQSKITSLQGTGMGISVFIHPAYLTVDGRITESRLVSFLEWLASERDAGRVEVLTVSGFAYADTGSDRRLNLAPSEKWASNIFELEIDPLYNWTQGAQLVLETTAHTAGQFTLSATSDTGGLSASKKVDGVNAGDRLRLVFSIPKSAKKITLHAYGNDRSLKVV